jgi:hypothetical protein
LSQFVAWLAEQQVQLVVMEATGDYWKPVFYLLGGEEPYSLPFHPLELAKDGLRNLSASTTKACTSTTIPT